MGSKLLPSKKSIEELLESINSEEDVITSGYSDDVFSFISHFKIEPGEELVLKKTLYELYKQWSKNSVSEFSFYSRATKLFISHTKGSKLYYKINIIFYTCPYFIFI